MTADEARRQYKREWARSHREQIKKTQKGFYERKAAEYEAAGMIEAGDPLPPRKLLKDLEKEIAALAEMIKAPEKAIPELQRRRRALVAEYERAKKRIYPQGIEAAK